MAPMLEWPCVPTGRNDQLIHVALASGPSTEGTGSIEWGTGPACNAAANREGALRLPTREPAWQHSERSTKPTGQSTSPPTVRPRDGRGDRHDQRAGRWLGPW